MMTSSALFARSLRRTCLAIACAASTSLAAQTVLPAYPTSQVERKDWLVDKIETKTGVYQTAEGHIVLSNGLTRRVFTQSPNVATISLDELTTNTSLLRLPGKPANALAFLNPDGTMVLICMETTGKARNITLYLDEQKMTLHAKANSINTWVFNK